MRIVAVSYRDPWPPFRGDAVRLLGLMTPLASHHDVTVVYPHPSPRSVWALADRGIKTAAAAPTATGPLVWAWAPGQVVLQSRWSAPRPLLDSADVIHASTVRSIPLVGRTYLPATHLDFVDALSINMRERARFSPAGSSFWHLEAARMERFETWARDRVRSASAISSVDASALGPPTRLVPPGVALPPYKAPTGALPTVVFVGNLGYYPNIDAARWLAQEVFPPVRRQLPAAQLRIVGARPARAVRHLTHIAGVSVIPDVPSTEPYLTEAWVVAAPIRYGTGVPSKVLEGLARGRAVITTAQVASRLGVGSPGTDYLVADTAAQASAALLGLLKERTTAESIGLRGRRAIESLSWHAAAERLLRAYGTGVP
jgi:glycosyltransferase involved in cell wall biosynthesis